MNKWRWYWKYIKNGLICGSSSLGSMWLFIEFSAFFSKPLAEAVRPYWWLFGLLAVAIALVKGRPVKSTKQRLSNIDTFIEITVKDIFKLKDPVVIGASTDFDTSIQDDIIDENSVMGQFIKNDYKGSVSRLDHDLGFALQGESYENIGEDKKPKGKRKRFPMGTVATIDGGSRKAYLVAMSTINEHGIASSTVDDIMDALPMLWEFIRTRGHIGSIAIPVLGTKYSRINVSHEKIIHEIIKSFVAACDTGRFCENLTIVIYPKDFKRGSIDLYRLSQFLEYFCKYGSNILSGNQKPPVGTPLESKIISQPSKDDSPKKETNISKNKTVKASDTYKSKPYYDPKNVVNCETKEPDKHCGNYWLLSDGVTGWIQIDLEKEYFITKIKLLNTKNSVVGNNHWTKKYKLELKDSDNKVLKLIEDIFPGPYSWKTHPFSLNEVRFVKLYVETSGGLGGGINEIDVYGY